MAAVTTSAGVPRGWLYKVAGVAAVAAGKVLGYVTVRNARRLAPMVPGLAGGVLASVGCGEVIGHVFGRGLAPWCALVIGSVFLLRLGAEVNRSAAPPPPGQDG